MHEMPSHWQGLPAVTFCGDCGTAAGYWRGPRGAAAVQFAAPQGSFPGVQEAMRPPWLEVEPKSANKAATAGQIILSEPKQRRWQRCVRHKEGKFSVAGFGCPTVPRVSGVLPGLRDSGKQKEQ